MIAFHPQDECYKSLNHNMFRRLTPSQPPPEHPQKELKDMPEWFEYFKAGFEICILLILFWQAVRLSRLTDEIREKYIESGYIPKELQELLK